MGIDPDSLWQSRLELRERLEVRREEIEVELHNRLNAIADTDGIADPEYVEGLQRAVAVGVAYALDALTCSERHVSAVPAVLLSQARLAARNGLALETVLLRYSACHTLINRLLAEEAEEAGLVDTVKLSDLLRVQGLLFDRLLEAVSVEHKRESERRSSTRRRGALVRALLAGEAVDASELRYEFDAFHIGAIAHGRGATSVVEDLASALDCIALVAPNDDGVIWAWLGRRTKPDTARLEDLVSSRWPAKLHLAIGEAATGFRGWRWTHRQAVAAFGIALRQPGRLVRYADVATLASMARDPLLAISLREIYLVPLASERDGGDTLRRTLRAYFTTGRNGASTAAALGVSRQTVTNRLRTVEARIGRSLSTCGTELEAALGLDELGRLAVNVD
jgi:hypothetical protein